MTGITCSAQRTISSPPSEADQYFGCVVARWGCSGSAASGCTSGNLFKGVIGAQPLARWHAVSIWILRLCRTRVLLVWYQCGSRKGYKRVSSPHEYPREAHHNWSQASAEFGFVCTSSPGVCPGAIGEERASKTPSVESAGARPWRPRLRDSRVRL